MSYDPFASAVEAGERPDQYFGEISLHVSLVNLEKGSPKVPWDSAVHSPANRRTEVEITIIPLAESGLVNPIQRSTIAESAEWSKIVWPSLRTCGVTTPDALRALHGKFASIEFAKTGRKYTNKQGEEMESTTVKFVAVHPDEATCLAAWKAARPGASAESEPTPAAAPVDNTERAMMAQFLPALVKQAGGDAKRLAEIFAANPMISKHFTVESPEVHALLPTPW